MFFLINSYIFNILNAMKRIIICICLFIVFSTSTVFAQQLGERVYKEVVVDGQQVGKWLEVYGVSEYDTNGRIIHKKSLDLGKDERFYEYDTKGNLIHEKGQGTWDDEYWYEYDAKGNLVREIYNHNIPDSYNTSLKKLGWDLKYEYEYDTNGKVIHKKSSKGNEYWYEYDAKGNLIHEKSNDNEYWYEYDAKGNLVHKIYSIVSAYSSLEQNSLYKYDAKGNKIQEQIITSIKTDAKNTTTELFYYYEYELWKDGKIKKQIQYSYL